jgi:16S rRNA (adenine(1408)-N(1))-methyltransferase
MADASHRAAAKPSRGGVENAMFVCAAAEALPGPLAGMADEIAINYPWGSLLRAVALPDADMLARIAMLARPGANVTAVINVQPLRDKMQARRLGLVDAALLHCEAALRDGYERAGLLVERVCRIADDAAPVTSWGKHLAVSKREVWKVGARCRVD